MKIHCDITLDDYKAFLKYVLAKALKSRAYKTQWLLIVFAFPIILGVVAGNVAPAKNDSALRMLLIGFAFGVAIFYALAISLARIQRRRLVPSPDGYVLGPLDVEILDEGIRLTSQRHESLFHWTLVSGPEITKDHIFIMLEPIAGIIIPLRSFKSDADREQFLAEIRSRAKRVS